MVKWYVVERVAHRRLAVPRREERADGSGPAVHLVVAFDLARAPLARSLLRYGGLECAMPGPSTPTPDHDPLEGALDAPGADDLLRLDLLRADLYRLIDELARAPSEERQGLVAEFEQTWARFKEASAPP
jgi:hypothetical protein